MAGVVSKFQKQCARSVTIFESGSGPGGRMYQRREKCEDGRELMFDHGAPYFSVNASNFEVQSLVNHWESRGLVAEWKEKFSSFDFSSKVFVNIDEEGLSKRYVGVPGMNSICRALCLEPGVKSRFGLGIGRLDWSEDDNMWSLTSLDVQDVGRFKGALASDKNTFSPRLTNVTGKPPPIGPHSISCARVRYSALSCTEGEVGWEFGNLKITLDLIHCFSICIQVPTKGFSFKNSKVLKRAFCDSSKPRRSTSSERWVLHSTAEYAEVIIAQTGFQKPSGALLTKVAEELFEEFRSTGHDISRPFFMKAHRWGSAFPAASVAGEETCLWVGNKRLAICGDFCVSPSVEGAICSGIAAAAKFIELRSTL